MNSLTLYRRLLKAGNKFSSYNFREYAKRRIREEFRNKHYVSSKEQIEDLLKFGQEQLKMLERQSIINSIYANDDLIINVKKF